MKKTGLFILLAVSLLTACRKEDTTPVYTLGVDLQTNFSQDNVQINIDNQPLLNRQVSSSTSIGLASSISTANTNGTHTIQVIINDGTTFTQQFTQHGDLYIGVNYNKDTKAVSLALSEKRFTY